MFCYKYFNGLFNSNMYTSIKGVLESFKTIIFKWQTARNSWADIRQLMYMPEMSTFLPQFTAVTTATYYAVTVGLTNTIIFELDHNLSFVDLYSALFELLLFLIFAIMSILLIRPIQRIMERYTSLFYVIPFELLEANMMLRHKLKKIPDNPKFFKL